MITSRKFERYSPRSIDMLDFPCGEEAAIKWAPSHSPWRENIDAEGGMREGNCAAQ